MGILKRVMRSMGAILVMVVVGVVVEAELDNGVVKVDDIDLDLEGKARGKR